MYRFIGILVIAAFLSLTASVDAQLFRRFRPGGLAGPVQQRPLQQQMQNTQRLQYAQQQQMQNAQQQQMQFAQQRQNLQPQRIMVQPQTVYQQPAPAAVQSTQPGMQAPSGYRLTYDAYGRVVAVPTSNAQVRVQPPMQQPVVTQRPITTPTPVTTPGAKVRVVTYYDPVAQRTFQRRFLLNPSQQSQPSAVSIPGTIVSGSTPSIATQAFPSLQTPSPPPAISTPTLNAPKAVVTSSQEMLPTITGPRTNNLQTTSPVQATTDPILDPEVQLTSLEEEVVPPNDAPSNELVPPNAEEFSVFNNEEEKKEVEAPKDVPEVKQDSDEFDLGIVPEVPETTTDESLEIDLPAKEEEIEVPSDAPEVDEPDEFDLGIIPDEPESTSDESLEIDLPAISGPRK